VLKLTPEQQAIFDRVVGAVVENIELRQKFKSAMADLHMQPNWDDAEYMSDSDDPPAANARAVNREIDLEVSRVAENLKERDSWLFHKICAEVCRQFIGS